MFQCHTSSERGTGPPFYPNNGEPVEVVRCLQPKRDWHCGCLVLFFIDPTKPWPRAAEFQQRQPRPSWCAASGAPPPAGWLAAVDAVSRRGPAFWRVGSSFLWDPTKLIRKRDELLKLFRGLDTAQCPFANLPEKKSGRWGAGLTAAKMDGCRWLRPELVGQFEYVEWTPRATSDTRVSSG